MKQPKYIDSWQPFKIKCSNSPLYVWKLNKVNDIVRFPSQLGCIEKNVSGFAITFWKSILLIYIWTVIFYLWLFTEKSLFLMDMETPNRKNKWCFYYFSATQTATLLALAVCTRVVDDAEVDSHFQVGNI